MEMWSEVLVLFNRDLTQQHKCYFSPCEICPAQREKLFGQQAGRARMYNVAIQIRVNTQTCCSPAFVSHPK